MGTLIIFNVILILAITGALAAAKKWVRRERAKHALFLVAPLLTVAVHYSSFFYHLLFTGAGIAYLGDTPNLILPIYPCNVVMWCALFYGLLRNKDSKWALLLSDYIFWFGLVSTLVGMFANVDFINNPTLADYENFKSIAAHATLLFNVLLLVPFNYVKTDVKRNITSIVISIFVMAAIGGYCNLVFRALASEEMAYEVNSMFLLHSPFDGLDFLTSPIIALIAIPIYLAIFVICNLCAKKLKKS